MSSLSDEDYASLLRAFPEVTFAFSYGSGVIEQKGYDQTLYKAKDVATITQGPQDWPLLDVIFAVDDPKEWHLQNRRRNPGHYTSLVSALSISLSPHVEQAQAGLIAYIQEQFGAHVWFNTHVPLGLPQWPGRQMKYGVISSSSMQRDLRDWDTLYIAGRLHKPVRVFREGAGDGLQMPQLIQSNRASAASAALLLLSSPEHSASASRPAAFSETDVYLTIAGLSYTGDPRMAVAENPQKVSNLVLPVLGQYQQLYKPTLLDLARRSGLKRMECSTTGCSSFSARTSEAGRHGLVQALPRNVRMLMPRHSSSAEAIRQAVTRIVRSSATSQSLKGVATVGLLKSGFYAWQKLKKRFGIK
jgi:translocator assembly and maintenance protein 41